MTYKQLYDYLKKLLEMSIQLNELSHSDDISYEKAIELRRQHDEIYKKWVFYKNLLATIGNSKSR